MELPATSAPAGGWLRSASRRIRFMWLTKMVGTTVIMGGFFVAYFWLLNHPRHAVTTIPRIFLDRVVGFRPEALALYVSLWFYIPIAPSLLDDRRRLLSYGAATIALSLAGFAVFILWPTAVPIPEVNWSDHPSMSWLKRVDASGNAFPSLHVAFAVFTAAWIERVLREMGTGRLVRALNWLWCLGIVYSTIATRQHVALDAVFGAVLGAVAAALHMRALRRP